MARTDASPAARIADPEPSPDEIVEADPACQDVAPRLAGPEVDPVVRGQLVDDLGLDQRDIPVGLRVLRPVAGPDGVSVAFEADARDGPNPGDATHRSAFTRRDVDRLDKAGTPSRLVPSVRCRSVARAAGEGVGRHRPQL